MFSFVSASMRTRTVGANEKHRLHRQKVACHLLLQMDRKWPFPQGRVPKRQGKVHKAFVGWFDSIPRRHSSFAMKGTG